MGTWQCTSAEQWRCLQSPAATSQPAAEKPLQAKPIYTSPHKKGSYGFNKTTLSERKGAQGVVRLPPPPGHTGIVPPHIWTSFVGC